MAIRILLSLYGLVLYHVFIFVVHKDDLDKRNISVDIKQYVKKYWDNWLFSALIIPVMVYFTPDILAIYNIITGSNLKFSAVFYICMGFLIEYLYGIFRKKDRDDFFNNSCGQYDQPIEDQP